MPSSFTQVLSSALEFSSRPPVSVFGTVGNYLKLRDFSWKLGISNFAIFTIARHHASALIEVRICLNLPPTRLNRIPTPGSPSLLRHPIAVIISTGILTCFPSTTRFRLALGADSPCADYRGAGNLGLTACGFFTRIIVTHVSIRTSDISSIPLETPSQTYRTLLYRSYLRMNP